MKALAHLFLSPIRQGWIPHLTLLSLLLIVSLAPAQEAFSPKEKEERELVRMIREKILATSPVRDGAAMEDYEKPIPMTGVPYHMVAIEGGSFLMGSPEDEPGRRDDEGPQREMAVAPFWMGKFEITWEQFEPFMITNVARHKDGSPVKTLDDARPVDLVSMPTTPYVEMSFGMGKGKHPAICMTQHAASKFCQWLSAQTGHYYRLPTEAEWEYACRAGTTTAYHFGDDPSKLHEYEWFWTEGGLDRYEEVGQKKPNPWGLYDMHGNVMEWCLDQYYADGYATNRKTIPATKLYPRVARGGSWYDDPELLRSAVRTASSRDWKIQDPELPKSLWYHTDATWLGFRIVRPLAIPSEEVMYQLWNSATGLTDPKE